MDQQATSTVSTFWVLTRTLTDHSAKKNIQLSVVQVATGDILGRNMPKTKAADNHAQFHLLMAASARSGSALLADRLASLC